MILVAQLPRSSDFFMQGGELMKLVLELVFVFCCGGMATGYFAEWRKERANKKMPPIKAAR